VKPTFQKSLRAFIREEVRAAIRAELDRAFSPPGKQTPGEGTQGHKIGRPVKHGRYSKAAGSDGKSPVIGFAANRATAETPR